MKFKFASYDQSLGINSTIEQTFQWWQTQLLKNCLTHSSTVCWDSMVDNHGLYMSACDWANICTLRNQQEK